MPCTKRNCCKKASLRRRSYSLHEGRLKVRDNSAHVVFTAWWEKHTSYASTAHLHRNGDKHRSRVSIRQDLPTACRHPLAPQDLPSHPTQREEEVKGRRGREKEKKKQDTDVKHAAHNHTDEMKGRLRETHYGTVTVMVMADCDVSGQDLRDRFLHPTVPAYCVSRKQSQIRLST